MGWFRDSLDLRALRFAVAFPLLLAAAFAVCAWLLRADLPEPVAIAWDTRGGTAFVPFGIYVLAGALLITAVGWVVFAQAVPISRPIIMRRIMMGLGLMTSLFTTSVLAAGIVGQAGVADARDSHVDATVLALGSGAALSLGVVMSFAFKPDARWTPEDDRALAREFDLHEDPLLAEDSMKLWVHARSSVFVMICVASLFPAALIAVALPWLGALLAVVAAVGAGFLFARVRADRRGLRVFVAGALRVLDVPAADITGATAADVKAADFGGWGFRHHGGSTAMLVSSGPAVLVNRRNGRRIALSAGTHDAAARLAWILNRVAARAQREEQPPQ
ncbi:hypothetical protein [Arthrobacter sp. M4]|uniref:hypothetical protein n=1 Tax=Arthrobacter sp. M4 TaxID=218160 RepID=UPI001CDC8784|nr:hypothetical protein [Arthrobacter sp. M4]MCA4131248.1 hypothetical protein [Arthrobacter sp. M4]